MLILGIESSSLVASAALLSDEKLIAEYTVNNAMTHSQTLMPMIDAVLKSAGTEPEELDAIAISRGPGSFTGLRIGSATAKGMGLALNKPLVEVPTLAAMAYGLYGITDRIICPIMDARRSEVYSAAYVFESVPGPGTGVAANNAAVNDVTANDVAVDDVTANEVTSNEVTLTDDMRPEELSRSFAMREILPETAGPVAELVNRLNGLAGSENGKYRGVIFLGDGVPPYRELIAEKMTAEYSFAPQFLSRQRAAAVAALGTEMFRLGKTVSADEHAPSYLRVSQAEREAAGKGN